MKNLDRLSKYSETSVSAEIRGDWWCLISRAQSKECSQRSKPCQTLSNICSDRSKNSELSLASNWWHQTIRAKAKACSQRSKPHRTPSNICSDRSKSSKLSLASNTLTDWWHQTIRAQSKEFSQRSKQNICSDRDQTSRYEVELTKQPADDSNSECYSPRPPASPMTVLSRSSMGDWTNQVKDSVDDGSDRVWLAPWLSLRPHRTFAEPPGSAGAPREAQRVVQLILQELIASLPLLASDAKNAKQAQSRSSIKSCDNASASEPGVVPLISPPRRRSVSLQTHMHSYQNVEMQSSCCGSETIKKCTVKCHRKVQEEQSWMGGVRALRDSHVRLVLRQLRHIERLNRALDRHALAIDP